MAQADEVEKAVLHALENYLTPEAEGVVTEARKLLETASIINLTAAPVPGTSAGPWLVVDVDQADRLRKALELFDQETEIEGGAI